VNGLTYSSASNAVVFTRASSQYLTLPDNTFPIGSSSFSIFFIFSPTSTGFEIQLITAGVFGGGNIFGIRSGNAGTGTLQTFWSGNNDIQTSNLWTVNTRNLGGFLYESGGTRSLWINGVQGTSDTPGAQTVITVNNRIGTLGSGAFNTFDGQMHEVLVFDSALTTSQRQAIEGYLARKWSVSSMIGHPYRFGGPGTIPSSISGLRLWIDAADPTAYTLSGSNVTGVRDKSPSNVSLSNVSGYVLSNTFNGGYPSFYTPTSRFGCLGQNSTFSINMNFTVFWVAVGGGFICDNMVAGNNRHYIWTPTNDSVYWTYSIQSTFRSSNVGVFSTVIGDQSNFYANGTAQSVTVANSGNVTSTGLTLANAWSLDAGWMGHICEILYYDGIVSSANRILLEGYLANKWGLNGRLPSPTTPYSSAIIPMRSFSPLDVDGLAVWLDAADATTLTLSGSNVTQWNDKSGNGRNATAGSGTVTVSSSVNGLPVLSIAGSTSLNVSNVTLTQSQSCVFFVFRATETKSLSGSVYFTWSRVGDDGGWNSSNEGFYPIFNGPVSYYALGVAGGGVGVMSRDYGGSSSSNPFLSATLATLFGNGGGWSNGVSLPIDTRYTYANPSNTLLNSAQTYQIGMRSAAGRTDSAAFDLAELIVYDLSTIGTGQRRQIENYLAQKWGLRGSMGGSAHPYRYGPPAIGTPAAYLPNLQLWLDAADSNAYTLSGSNVTAVIDKSSNAWALGSAANITLNSTKFNGIYPSFYSVGAGLGSNTSFAIQQPITVYFAGQSLNTWGSAYLFDSINSSSRVAMNSGVLIFAGSADVVSTNNSECLSPHVFCATFNGSNSSIVLNGTTTTGNPGSQGFSGIVLSKGDGYRGHICELLMFTGTHTTAQVQAMMGYLAWKWGIPSVLPGVSSNYGRIGRALTPAFVPTQISGCALWLDAADRTTVALSGSNVTQWLDKSGNGYNTSSVLGSPVWSSNQILLNGSSTALIGPYSNATSTLTAFVVASVNFAGGISNFYWRLLSIGSTSANDFNSSAYAAVILREANTSNVGGYRNGATNYVVPANNTPFLFVQQYNGSTAQLYLNGTSGASTGSGGSFGTSAYAIGRDVGNTDNGGAGIFSYWPGSVSEVLLYNTDMTPSQRQRIEGYLAQKWGLTAVLGGTAHPYKYGPWLNLPTSIPGCALWLDAADATTLTLSGSNVTQWNDKSGNGRNATGGVSPTFSNSGVVFNGANTYLATTYSAVPTAETFFCVATWTGSASRNYCIIGTSATNGRNFNILPTGGSNTIKWDKWGVAGYAYTGGVQSNVPFLASGFFTGSNGQTTLNGGTSSTIDSFSFSGTGTTNIGTGVLGDYYQGTINEIVIYNTVLTSTQRQQIEGYLAWKWGLSANLPGPTYHPYRGFKP